MTEPNAAAVVDDQDPEADTPETDDQPDPQDTPDQPEQPTDWEARYKEQAKLHGRQEAELAIWRRGETPKGPRSARTAAPPPDEGDEGTADGQESELDEEYVSQLEGQSWDLAESRYGAQAVEAYSAAYQILDRAQTPADFIAAFEAYHDIRSKGGSPDAAAAAAGASGNGTRKSRAAAVEPRVDPNTSDAGPDLTDKNVEEARKSGDLGKFVTAATRAMGFGGDKRTG